MAGLEKSKENPTDPDHRSGLRCPCAIHRVDWICFARRDQLLPLADRSCGRASTGGRGVSHGRAGLRGNAGAWSGRDGDVLGH